MMASEQGEDLNETEKGRKPDGHFHQAQRPGAGAALDGGAGTGIAPVGALLERTHPGLDGCS